jgi:hypothetical protein
LFLQMQYSQVEAVETLRARHAVRLRGNHLPGEWEIVDAFKDLQWVQSRAAAITQLEQWARQMPDLPTIWPVLAMAQFLEGDLTNYAASCHELLARFAATARTNESMMLLVAPACTLQESALSSVDGQTVKELLDVLPAMHCSGSDLSLQMLALAQHAYGQGRHADCLKYATGVSAIQPAGARPAAHSLAAMAHYHLGQIKAAAIELKAAEEIFRDVINVFPDPLAPVPRCLDPDMMASVALYRQASSTLSNGLAGATATRPGGGAP